MSDFSMRMKALVTDNVKLDNEEADQRLQNWIEASNDVDLVADDMESVILLDPTSEPVVAALVDLAELAGQLGLSPANEDALNSIVDRLVVSGTDEQKEKVKAVFRAVLKYQLVAKEHNTFFNAAIPAAPEMAISNPKAKPVTTPKSPES